jgi:L-fuconolactonase
MLRCAAAAAAAALLAVGAQGQQLVLDGHVHLTNFSMFDYLWANASMAAGCPCAPPCPCTWAPADWAAASLALAPAKFVFVEVDVNSSQWLDEAAWAASIGDPRLGAVIAQQPPGWGVPGTPLPQLAAALDALVARSPLIHGIRASGVNYSDATQMAALTAQAALLAPRGLSMDVNTAIGAPGAVDGVLALARALPGTTFVLDHAGSPPVLGTPEAGAAWAAAISALAGSGCGNVYVKTGGMLQGWKAAGVFPSFDDVRPWLAAVLAAFTPAGRAFFEGNWFFIDWAHPAELAAYTLWARYVAQGLDEAGSSAGVRDAFFYGAGAAAYRVDM